jgi:hypothetical protein
MPRHTTIPQYRSNCQVSETQAAFGRAAMLWPICAGFSTFDASLAGTSRSRSTVEEPNNEGRQYGEGTRQERLTTDAYQDTKLIQSRYRRRSSKAHETAFSRHGCTPQVPFTSTPTTSSHATNPALSRNNRTISSWNSREYIVGLFLWSSGLDVFRPGENAKG